MGSREGADIEHLRRFLTDLWKLDASTILVSGGNHTTEESVDWCAEQFWLERGGSIVSLRPKKKDDENWCIEEWTGDDGGFKIVRVMNEMPTTKDFTGAATLRDWLIAERSARLVVFYKPGRSPGARTTAIFARDFGREVYEFERVA